jgi:hypothetical protein
MQATLLRRKIVSGSGPFGVRNERECRRAIEKSSIGSLSSTAVAATQLRRVRFTEQGSGVLIPLARRLAAFGMFDSFSGRNHSPFAGKSDTRFQFWSFIARVAAAATNCPHQPLSGTNDRLARKL